MPLILNTGMGASWPGVNGTNGGGGMKLDGRAAGVLSVGTLALAVLVYIWWSLPR